ncbi:hypothetical protein KCU78_g1027, partial [Aureobasidium melanogenum]
MTEHKRISVMQDDERPEDPGASSTSKNMSSSEAFSMMEEISRRRVPRHTAHKFVRELWLVQYDDEGDDDVSELRKKLSSAVWDSSKPPDETMDRAMEFARAADIRQIWVDKACIAQLGAEEAEGALPREHQLSIQAMDLVYQRAIGCIGLMDGKVTQSGWLEALERFYRLGKRGIFADDDDFDKIMDGVLSLLEHIADDRFNERAWILQEGISAGNTMALSMRIGPDVEFSSQLRQDLGIPQVVERSVLFTFGELQRIAIGLENVCTNAQAHGEDVSTEGLREVLKKFDMMHPRPLIRNSQVPYFHMLGGYNYSSVSRCTAATALNFLRPRDNLHLEDRLAILANMCDYEVRVDIEQAQECPSLAVAHMAQAIMNGDLSLLIPELNKIDQPDPLWNCVWCPRPSEAVSRVVSRQARANSTVLERFGWNNKITKEGLSCHATIWEVQDKVDLRDVRAVWGQQWAQWLKESSGDLRSKSSEICRILFDILKKIQDSGLSSLADSIWISTRRELLKPRSRGCLWIDTPDTVSDILASPALMSRVDELFELSWDNSKTFQEIWIIRRAMCQGHLWYGQAQQGCFPKRMQLRQEIEPDYNDQGVTATDAKVAMRKKHGIRTIAELMIMQRKLTSMWRVQSGFGDDPDSQARVNSGAALTAFTINAFYDEHLDAIQDLRGELGAFDVDGPMMIAIPYDSALETLPRALERSMSVCWMIKHEPSPEALGIPEDKTETVEDTITDGGGGGVVTHDGFLQELVDELSQGRWRVVGKVRGCWPVMELIPMGSHMFV